MDNNNPFASFLDDNASPVSIDPVERENPFAQFAAEPAEEARPSSPKPVAAKAKTPELDHVPGFSVVTEDPVLQDAFSRFEASNKRQGTEALHEARGNGFIDGILDSKQYSEFGKGFVPGAIGMAGTALKLPEAPPAMAQYNAASFGRQQLAIFDKIDRGEAVPPVEDPAGYASMSPDQRLSARADVERAASEFNPTPLQDRPLFRAGTAVSKFGRELIPAAPGYEESVGRQLGEGLGSMFAGLPISIAGGPAAGAVFFGASGGGEAAENALAFDRKEKAAGRPGLTQEQLIMASVAGIAPGLTDLAPVELLLGRLKIPPQFQRIFARAIAKKGGEFFVKAATQAAAEGGQEGFQQFLQNGIAKEIYNPKQSLSEGVLPNAAVGAGVGGIAETASQVAKLLIRNAAGRRGGSAHQAGTLQEPQEAPVASPAIDGAPIAPVQPAATSEATASPEAAPQPTLAPEVVAEAEQSVVLPEIERQDAELSTPVIKPAYDSLDETAKQEVITRAKQGEDVGDLVEEMAIRSENIPAITELVTQRGLSPSQASEVRAIVAEQQPEMLTSFDEMAKQLPVRAEPSETRAASLERASERSAKRLQEVNSDLQVVINSATLMKDDLAGLEEMSRKIEKLRAGEDDRNSWRKLLDKLTAFDPQTVRDLRAKALESKQQSTVTTGRQLQSDYQRLVQEAGGLIADLESVQSQRQKAVAGPKTAPKPETLRAFGNLLDSKTPQSQWASELGISEEELSPLVDQAIAKNWLRRDSTGRLARTPKTQRVGGIAPMAVPVNVPAALPGEGNAVFTDAAQAKRADMQDAVDLAAARILPTAVRVEVVDKIDIAQKAFAEDQKLAIRAYHGTRHDFDKFDISKIGTGEGAQVFGHGLYFAEAEAVADSYRVSLADEILLNGERIEDEDLRTAAHAKLLGKNLLGQSIDDLLRGAEKGLEQAKAAPVPPDDHPMAQFMSVDRMRAQREQNIVDAEAYLQKVKAAHQGDVKSAGHLYEVDIDVEPKDLLDWDTPLSQQSEAVRSALGKLGVEDFDQAGANVYEDLRVSGGQARALEAYGRKWDQKYPDGNNVSPKWTAADQAEFQALKERSIGSMSPDALSRKLSEAGIKGIRYLDQGSRGEGTGTSNIVLFDDKLVTITKKNGEPVSAKERKQVVDQMLALRGFYSPAIRAAEGISMKKGTGEQFLKQITKMPGVRKDEIEWMGLEEFLADKKSITRDEVLAFMQAHQVELDEKVLGDFSGTETQLESINAEDAAGRGYDAGTAMHPHEEYWSARAGDAEFIVAKRRSVQVYDLFDPKDGRDFTTHSLSEAQHIVAGWHGADRGGGEVRFAQHKVPGGENYRELLIRLPELEGKYKSKHFDDQEIVHLRVDDRTGPNGEKVLFINEVQSDLHQAGRTAGYRDGKVKFNDISDLERQKGEAWADVVRLGSSPEADAARQRHAEIAAQIRQLSSETDSHLKQVPNAPFKGELWLELALKRALLYASENGYDAVSWARSDQIAKAVGAEPEKLALQYDSKIGKFLDKYTKKWSGQIGEAAIVDRAVEPNLPDRLALVVEDYGGTIDSALREMPDDMVNERRQLEAFRDQATKLRPGGVNPILRITPQMRASVMEGQPLAARKTGGQPEALGRTDPYTMTISIAAHAVEAEAAAKGVSETGEAVRVLRHEAVEFFKATGMFTDPEWKLLKKAAKEQGWVESTGVREAYSELYKDGMSDAELESLLLKEAIAEQYSEFHLGRKEFKGPIRIVFQRIKDFLARIMNAIKGMGFQTWEDVFESIDAGDFASRFDAAMAGTQESAAAPQASGGVRTGSAAIQATAGKLADSPSRQASAGLTEPSVKLADLISTFNKTLGITARQGRLDPGLKIRAAQQGADVRGQTSFDTGIVRLRVTNEIDTLAHEGGHVLEIKFGGNLDAVKQQFAAELTPLASPGPDALSEGFAEWFRRYVTNPAASRRAAPGFEAAFETFVNSKNPEIIKNLRSVRDGYQTWLKAPSGGVVASAMATTVKPGTVEEVTREINDKGFKNTVKAWTDKLYTSVFDDLHPVNMAVSGLLDIARTNIGKGQDIDLKTANNPYKLLRLARDAYAAGHMDLLYGVAGYKETTPQGPSFREAMATAFGGLSADQWNEAIAKQFGAYLTSRRMVQEWARYTAGDITSPPDKFSLADHQQSIKDYEAQFPQFKLAAQQVYSYLGNILRKKRDAGLITPELYAELTQRDDYVPVLRDMSDRGDGNVEGMAPSRKDKQSVIKKFRGSQRDVINPLESIAKDTYETAMIIARNDAIKALDALARAAGPDAGKFAERIPAHEMKASQVNIQDAIKKAADAAGISAGDLQVMIQAVDDKLGDNAIAQVWKSGEVNEKGEPIVYLWEGGKRIPIRLADGKFGHEMLHAVTGLGKEASGWFVNLMSLPSSIVRFGVTASADFIGANILRDQVSAWVLMKDFTPFADGARGIYNDLSMQEVSRIYSRAGGIFGGANTTSLHESRIKRELLELRKRGIRFTLNPMTRDFWRMTEFSETGTRIAVFEKAFTRAKKDGLNEWESALEAAFAARDLIDFGRRGSRMLAARRLVPFLNASLQGLDRTTRGLRGKVDDHRVLRDAISPYIKSRTGQPLSVVDRRNHARAARVWGHMVALGMLGLALSYLYKDDEEHEEISDYIKATHWIFRVNGEWVRIPKPFELAFFSNLLERTFEYVYKDDPTAVKRFTDGLFQILVPPHSVPGLQVGTELMTNYSFFADRPIVGNELKGLPPEMQFNAYASEFGKYLGKQVGVSPAYIDHFVTGFGASWGREFLNAANTGLPALGRATGGAFGLPTAQAANSRPQDYFFIRRFLTDATRGSSSTREFWSKIGEDGGKFTEAANGYKLLSKKIRDALGAQEFLDELPEEERAYALLEAGNTDDKAKLQLIHPLNRAKEINSVASGLRREMNMHRLFTGKGENVEQVSVSPSQMREVDDVLAQITMREARNALIALNTPGWSIKKIMPVEPLYDELAAASPEVHEIMLDRLKGKKLPSFDDSRKGWPEARDRLLQDGQKALLRDLYSREIPTWGQSGGYEARP